MKKSGFVICILLSLVLLASCNFVPEVSDKNFMFEELRITLTDEFTEAEQNGFDICFISQDVAVFVLREEFSSEGFAALDGDVSSLSLGEYAELVLDNNPGVEAQVNEEDGLVYFEYDASVEDYTYSNLIALYKSADSFWVVDFYCIDSLYDDNRADIVKWAKTVTFVEE